MPRSRSLTWLLDLLIGKFEKYSYIFSRALSFETLTLRPPLRRKLLIRWFLDISKVKESSFFLNRTSLTPHQIFDAHLLKNTDLSPSRFHFSVGLGQDNVLSHMVL